MQQFSVMQPFLQSQFVQIALPIVVTLIVATWNNNKRFDDMNNRFNDMNRRFDNIEQRLSRIETTLEDHGRRLAVLEERMSLIRR